MLVTIITDASFCPDTGAAGYGYWCVSARGKEAGGAQFKSPLQNSIAAEMMAVVNSGYVALRNKIALPGDCLLFQTDCQAAIGAFLGNRNWYGLTPSEKKAVSQLATLLKKSKCTVQFKHVKGHTDGSTPRTWVNNFCDEKAGKHMRRMRKQILNKRGQENGDCDTFVDSAMHDSVYGGCFSDGHCGTPGM